MLKLLVPVKRVLDVATKVRIRPDKTGVDLSGVKMSMNPFCQNAIEEAARLKTAGHVEDITCVSIGPK
jgi:electron transfer flavoprotein beta subunit